MATQSTSGQRRSAAQRRKKKKTRNIIILVVEVLILFIMLGVLWFVIKATDKETGMQKVEIPSEEVIINEEVVENEVLETYRTIALFGLDSTVGELTSNTRSDTIIQAGQGNFRQCFVACSAERRNSKKTIYSCWGEI